MAQRVASAGTKLLATGQSKCLTLLGALYLE